jgi:uncharacterized protein YjbI with pentapeptide repeats
MQGCRGQDLQLDESILDDVDLAAAIAPGLRAVDTSLRGAKLEGANLSKAELTRVVLAGAGLMRARLDRAFFVGCDLRTVSLELADLSHGRLNDTDLRGATIERCVLDGTGFTRCKMAGLRGQPDLRGAAVVERADLSPAGDGSDVRDSVYFERLWKAVID